MSKQSKARKIVNEYLNTHGDVALSPAAITLIREKTKCSPVHARRMVYIVRREWRKEQIASSHTGLATECDTTGIPLESVSHYWHKSKHYSVFVKNQPKSYEEIRDSVIAEMQDYAPKYPKLKRKVTPEAHLLVIDPADIHMGKLCESFETGEDYDNQIAVQRVKDGVSGILQKSAHLNIDKILFVIGNDVLHIDSPKRQTTSGTPQDTSGMWYSNFVIAKELYVEIIEILVTLANVHVTFNPSNHDFMSGFFLADTVASWFSKNANVTFDNSPAHRKYFRYHNNIIGTTHGDGAKTADLPLLMAQESGQDWLAKHRYVYTHHVHHKNSKDYGSVCVESLRSPSGTDSWHHRNGYQHSPKAIEGYVHHKEHGQISRLTHIF
jgi:hypothetical protein